MRGLELGVVDGRAADLEQPLEHQVALDAALGGLAQLALEASRSPRPRAVGDVRVHRHAAPLQVGGEVLEQHPWRRRTSEAGERHLGGPPSASRRTRRAGRAASRARAPPSPRRISASTSAQVPKPRVAANASSGSGRSFAFTSVTLTASARRGSVRRPAPLRRRTRRPPSAAPASAASASSALASVRDAQVEHQLVADDLAEQLLDERGLGALEVDRHALPPPSPCVSTYTTSPARSGARSARASRGPRGGARAVAATSSSPIGAPGVSMTIVVDVGERELGVEVGVDGERERLRPATGASACVWACTGRQPELADGRG
jgi:hypothetical protein